MNLVRRGKRTCEPIALTWEQCYMAQKQMLHANSMRLKTAQYAALLLKNASSPRLSGDVCVLFIYG